MKGKGRRKGKRDEKESENRKEEQKSSLKETRPEFQNRVIIALLARSTIGIDKIASIVKYKKASKQNEYIKAYNALDGSKSINEIAAMIPTSKQNMNQILQTWEEKGIVFKTGSSTRSKYIGLLQLQVEPKPRGVQKKASIAGNHKAANVGEEGNDLAVGAAQNETATQTSDNQSP